MVHIDHEQQPEAKALAGDAIPCPTCTALAYLALILKEPVTGEVYRIHTCDRCGRVLWRNAAQSDDRIRGSVPYSHLQAPT